jgi:hypothetical protein
LVNAFYFAIQKLAVLSFSFSYSTCLNWLQRHLLQAFAARAAHMTTVLQQCYLI